MSAEPIKSWTRLLGSSKAESANSITTGSDGSIYIAGITSGNLDGNSNAGGYGDAFLSKYNSDGTKSWTRLLGTNSYDYANSITTGSDGSIYIAGSTGGNLDGNSNAGNYDAFLSKYNSDGTKSWTRLLGTSGDDFANSVTTGSDGSIYIAGRTDGNLDGNSNAGERDAFLSKYNSDGTKSWTRLLGSSAYDWAYSVTTGSDASIYIAGTTKGNLDGNSNAGEYDAFLSKFSFPATYTLTPSLATINEDAVLTNTVATTNVATGTKLYYALSGTGITTADFSAGALTGEGITDSTGKFTFTHTLANDLTTEGAETLNIKLYSDVARTLQVGATASVSIVDSSIKSKSFNLDVDGDGKITALGDGLMIIRKLFGAAFAGDALTNEAMSPNSTRTTAEIHEFIQQGITTGLLDVDKDGKTTALGDGLMLIRHLSGAAFANEALTNKAISPSSPYFGPPANFAAVAANIDEMRPV